MDCLKVFVPTFCPSAYLRYEVSDLSKGICSMFSVLDTQRYMLMFSENFQVSPDV